MPGFGLTPARGDWETKWFDVLSTATFLKGSLVQLGSDYRVREYASTDSSVLGIALAPASSARTWAGGVLGIPVALPAPKCTAWSDVTTGVTQSSMSVGKKVCGYKEGNLASYASTVMGQSSRFSALFTVMSRIDSVNSRVEVAFNMENVGIYSGSSTTYAS